MSKKALILAVIYSVIVIAIKLFIWKGGHTFNPAYRWVHGFTVVGIIPFMIAAVKWVKDGENGGFIGGKQAGQVGLQVTMIAVIILFAYNYIEFKSNIPLYEAYYRGPEFFASIENNPEAKKIGYDKVIESMITGLSPFKATTMKMLALLIISFPCAFLSAAFMKKSRT